MMLIVLLMLMMSTEVSRAAPSCPSFRHVVLTCCSDMLFWLVVPTCCSDLLFWLVVPTWRTIKPLLFLFILQLVVIYSFIFSHSLSPWPPHTHPQLKVVIKHTHGFVIFSFPLSPLIYKTSQHYWNENCCVIESLKVSCLHYVCFFSSAAADYRPKHARLHTWALANTTFSFSAGLIDIYMAGIVCLWEAWRIKRAGAVCLL